MNKNKIKQLAIVLILLSRVGFVFAQEEATESSQPEVTAVQEKEEEVMKNLRKSLIDKAVEKHRNKTMDKITKRKKGFIGEVQRVSEGTITIKNPKGTKILPIDDGVLLIKNKKETSVEKIAVGDWILALGWMEDDAFVPKKLLIYSKTLRPEQHKIMLGTIETIKKTQLQFKPRSNENTETMVMNSKTKYQDYEGNEAKRTDFDDNMQTLLLSYQDDDDKIIKVLRALAPFSINEEND